MMLEDTKLVDILGDWKNGERFLSRYLKNSTIVPPRILEPYYWKNPWTKVLKGKKVLVVHPFDSTIEMQYHNNREKLFKDKNILPLFKSLQTIKAVQTIAGEKSRFKSWFDALDYMKGEIDKKDFDIAIIGCGAYDFPLAAHVKRIGKKSILLGGATQILFGIKGKRWLENENFNNIINEHFVFPSKEDTPKNAKSIEGGCYW